MMRGQCRGVSSMAAAACVRQVRGLDRHPASALDQAPALQIGIIATLTWAHFCWLAASLDRLLHHTITALQDEDKAAPAIHVMRQLARAQVCRGPLCDASAVRVRRVPVSSLPCRGVQEVCRDVVSRASASIPGEL